MFSRLWPYCRSARPEIAGGMLLLVVSSAMELLQPWPIKWLVDHAFGGKPAPKWLEQAWPAFATHDVPGCILAVCASIMSLAVVHRLAGVCSQFLLIRAGGKLVRQLRCGVCNHLHRLSLTYHDRTHVGDSLYRLAYDTQAAQSLLSGAIAPAIGGALILLSVTIVMLRMDVVLTIVALAITPLFYVLIRVFEKNIGRHSKRYHELESSLVSSVQESLSSIRAVQAFTRETDTAYRFKLRASDSLHANQRLALTQLAFSACVGLCMAAGTAIVVWFGATGVYQGRLTLGDILVFLAYLGMLYQPMSAFSQGANVVQAARAQLWRVFDLLETPLGVADRPGARKLPKVEGRLEVHGLTFEYEPGRPVLRHIDFAVEPGQVVALVGRTGAGKTTLASMLLRFYDPVEGSITLDGHDLRDLQLEWLRQQVSIVLQDPILFSATIAENIAYGRPNATQEEIERASRQAQAHEFIERLPDGYETVLGERGVNLSGGQRQRLAIARAFLKDAPVLILDEPTSALDAETERSLLIAQQQLTRGRTTLIIAHRLSTVRAADTILVLDGGRIVEQGSHDELVRFDSAYRRFYRSQTANEAPRTSEAAVSQV